MSKQFLKSVVRNIARRTFKDRNEKKEFLTRLTKNSKCTRAYHPMHNCLIPISECSTPTQLAQFKAQVLELAQIDQQKKLAD